MLNPHGVWWQTGEKKKMGNRESLSFYHGEISFFHPQKGENPALFIRWYLQETDPDTDRRGFDVTGKLLTNFKIVKNKNPRAT